MCMSLCFSRSSSRSAACGESIRLPYAMAAAWRTLPKGSTSSPAAICVWPCRLGNVNPPGRKRSNGSAEGCGRAFPYLRRSLSLSLSSSPRSLSSSPRSLPSSPRSRQVDSRGATGKFPVLQADRDCGRTSRITASFRKVLPEFRPAGFSRRACFVTRPRRDELFHLPEVVSTMWTESRYPNNAALMARPLLPSAASAEAEPRVGLRACDRSTFGAEARAHLGRESDSRRWPRTSSSSVVISVRRAPR